MKARLHWFPAAVLLILLVLSLLLRCYVAKGRPMSGYRDNDDATAHVLATLVAYQQTPSSIHHYLPLFTYGAPTDKWIDDLPTASGFDKYGNLYYTSFPPLGFIVPHFIFSALGISPQPFALRCFSMVLHLIATGLLCLLLQQCLSSSEYGKNDRWIILAGTASIYLFSFECLRSYTICYWAHQLYQVILFGTAIAYACCISCRPGNKLGFATSLCFLYLLSLTGCLLEWTAFVTSASICLLSLLRIFIGKKWRDLWVAAISIVAVSTALLVLIVWFSSVLDIPDYLTALATRSHVRNGGGNYFDKLFVLGMEWVVSLGPFWVLFFLLLSCLKISDLYSGANQFAHGRFYLLDKPVGVIGLLLFLTLSENILLPGHGSLYTFDILKLVGFFAFAMGALCVVTNFNPTRFLILCSAASLVSLGMFAERYARSNYPENWTELPLSWQMKFGSLVRLTSKPDSVAFATTNIRGAEVFYSGRNIFQNIHMCVNGKSIEQFVKNWCLSHGANVGNVYYVGSTVNPIIWVETVGIHDEIKWRLFDLEKLPVQISE